MSIRVTITKPGVTDGYGLPMVVGTTYTVEENFGLSLISQGRASDTDSSSVDPGVGEGTPQNIVFVNAATIASPTAAMLRDYGTEYALDVAPFTRYRSNGSALSAIPEYPVGTAKKMALFGDSQARNNNWDGLAFTSKFNSQLGPISYSSILCQKKFVTTPALNFGVFGNKTTQMIERISDVIAAAPDEVTVWGGINDIVAGSSADDVYANLLTIAARFRAAGIRVYMATVYPSNFASVTATMAKHIMRLNALLRKVAPTLKNFYLWDTFPALADPASTSAGAVSAFMEAAGLHVNKLGGYWTGKSHAAVWLASHPEVGYPQNQLAYASDLYDATYFPQGNKFTNAILAGTGGTASTGCSGDVATSWTAVRAAGSTLTCVASKGTVTLDNGQTYATQILTITAPGGGIALEEIALYQNITTAADDLLICGADITVASVTGRLNYVTPQLQAQYGSFSLVARDLYYAAGGADSIPEGFTGHSCTVEGTAPTGGTSTRGSIVVGMDGTVVGGCVVTIGLPYFRKVG